jgi:hypothetical protein
LEDMLGEILDTGIDKKVTDKNLDDTLDVN